MKNLKLLLLATAFFTISSHAKEKPKEIKSSWEQQEENIKKEDAKLEDLINTSKFIVYGELMYPVSKIRHLPSSPKTPAIKIRVIEVTKGSFDQKYIFIPQYNGYVPDYDNPYPIGTRVLVFAKNTKTLEGATIVDESDGKERVKIFTPPSGRLITHEPYDSIKRYMKSFQEKEPKKKVSTCEEK